MRRLSVIRVADRSEREDQRKQFASALGAALSLADLERQVISLEKCEPLESRLTISCRPLASAKHTVSYLHVVQKGRSGH